jgi:hypothetical protein
MNPTSTLYWSHLGMYEACPQKFLWTKGWDGVDCGHGPGKAKPNPSTSSRHHAVMGIAIQDAVEKMYNEELYRNPATLSQTMLDLAERAFHRQESKPWNTINYSEARMSRAEMLQICRDGAVGFLQTMKAHRLLGPYAKAEVDLVGWVDSKNPIGGRADTIIRRDDTGVTIIDGKNTAHKMKYTDPDQLRWYALLFKLAYRELPSRLAYVWYRFPHGHTTRDGEGVEQVETGVEWVSFDEEDLRGLAQRALLAKKGMGEHQFDPTPTAKGCRFCDYEPVCEARQTQREANSRKRNKKNDLIELSAPGSGGFVDFTME